MLGMRPLALPEVSMAGIEIGRGTGLEIETEIVTEV